MPFKSVKGPRLKDSSAAAHSIVPMVIVTTMLATMVALAVLRMFATTKDNKSPRKQQQENTTSLRKKRELNEKAANSVDLRVTAETAMKHQNNKASPAAEVLTKAQVKRMKRAAIGPESDDKDLVLLSALSGTKVSTFRRQRRKRSSRQQEDKQENRSNTDDQKESMQDSKEEKVDDGIVDNRQQDRDDKQQEESSDGGKQQHPQNIKEVKQQQPWHNRESSTQSFASTMSGSCPSTADTARQQIEALNHTIKILMQSLSSSQLTAKSDAARVKTMAYQITNLQAGISGENQRYKILERAYMDLVKEREKAVGEDDEPLIDGYYWDDEDASVDTTVDEEETSTPAQTKTSLTSNDSAVELKTE